MSPVTTLMQLGGHRYDENNVVDQALWHWCTDTNIHDGLKSNPYEICVPTRQHLAGRNIDFSDSETIRIFDF